MQVLVTGGTGFIGAHVLNQLVDRGHEVVCFDTAEPTPIARQAGDAVEFVRGDITDEVTIADTFTEFEPDRVVHLASLLGRSSRADPRAAFRVNVNGTLTVLELAENYGVERLVVASSVSAYGDLTGRESLDENAVQDPSNVYGVTKYAIERLGGIYRDERGVEFAALEPVHGLGPDRVRGNVEDAAIVKAGVSGEPLTIPAVEQPIEIIYVEDTARAFVAATLAEELSYDRYLVGTGERATLTEIAETVSEHVPDACLEVGDPPDDNTLTVHPPTDAARISEDLDWEPSHTIDEGIAAYVEWLRENPEKWSFDPENVPWGDD